MQKYWSILKWAVDQGWVWHFKRQKGLWKWKLQGPLVKENGPLERFLPIWPSTFTKDSLHWTVHYRQQSITWIQMTVYFKMNCSLSPQHPLSDIRKVYFHLFRPSTFNLTSKRECEKIKVKVNELKLEAFTLILLWNNNYSFSICFQRRECLSEIYVYGTCDNKPSGMRDETTCTLISNTKYKYINLIIFIFFLKN